MSSVNFFPLSFIGRSLPINFTYKISCVACSKHAFLSVLIWITERRTALWISWHFSAAPFSLFLFPVNSGCLCLLEHPAPSLQFNLRGSWSLPGRTSMCDSWGNKRALTSFVSWLPGNSILCYSMSSAFKIVASYILPVVSSL